VLWQFVGPFLVATRQDPEIARIAHQYVQVQSPSVPLFLIYTAQRQYLQGRGILRPALLVAHAANVLNVALNTLFIFGGMGIPALGAVGSGIATSIVQASMPLMMYGLMRSQRLCDGAWEPWSRDALDLAELRKILAVGVPIGLHFAAEIWGFQIAGLWSGWLGKAELAANSIVLNLASISFMLPLGVGLGSVTRIGNLVGAGRSQDAQVSAWAALALGAGLMALCALVFLLIPEPLARAYSKDPIVIALAVATLPPSSSMACKSSLSAARDRAHEDDGARQPHRVLRDRPSARVPPRVPARTRPRGPVVGHRGRCGGGGGHARGLDRGPRPRDRPPDRRAGSVSVRGVQSPASCTNTPTSASSTTPTALAERASCRKGSSRTCCAASAPTLTSACSWDPRPWTTLASCCWGKPKACPRGAASRSC
jgi:hypothetical protein